MPWPTYAVRLTQHDPSPRATSDAGTATGLGLGPVPMLVACALSVVAALCSFARYTTLTRAGYTMATLRQGN